MELLELLGFAGAFFIGVVLGLIGGGGSILTVPVLVYLLSINPVTATAYSLFVVGTSALIGSIKNMKKKLIAYRMAVVFSVPAFIAVYLTRKFIMPAIPPEIIHFDAFTLTRNRAIMLFFALIMILASLSMIIGQKEIRPQSGQLSFNYPLIILEGFVVGILTGIVGAGGGFLIIPALVLLAKLPMKRAVATSLVIIAVKSLIGFVGDVQNLDIEWSFLLWFTALAVAGIFFGGYLHRFIQGNKLKKGFGFFVLLMGFYIIWSEL